MVDLRIYRASFVVALLALLVVMFSLQERPHPLGATLAPDAFKGDEAYAETSSLVNDYPDRKPGSAGDEALGNQVERRFRAIGFETSRERFTDGFKGDEVSMSNVIGLLRAPSDRQVVVMAPRDAAGRTGASSASSTAVMLELAGALDGSQRQKTFVFVSLDGAAADSAGAREFVDSYPDRNKIDAVLVLDDIGATRAKRPFVLPWSSSPRRSSLQVTRTAAASLSREAGVPGATESWPAQFVRQAWPLTLREQGPLVDAGLDAVTLTSRGEVPRGATGDTLDSLSQDRLIQFGRSAFATLLAYDDRQSIETSTDSYLVMGSKVIPDWAISLFAVGLVLPAVIASVDAFARSRRRGLPIGGWMRWALAGALPFAITLIAIFVFRLAGWLPDSAPAALSPSTAPSVGAALLALLALGVFFAVSWLFVRPAAMGPARPLGERRRLIALDPAPAVALSLLLSLEVLLVCAFNPFTALVLVPAAHLCMLAALPERPRPALVGGGVLTTALVLPALAALYYGFRLDLGLEPTSYALMAVGAAASSPWTAVLVSLVAGTVTSALIVHFAGASREAESPITVRGPASYAGPGSLGGTESALRR